MNLVKKKVYMYLTQFVIISCTRVVYLISDRILMCTLKTTISMVKQDLCAMCDGFSIENKNQWWKNTFITLRWM